MLEGALEQLLLQYLDPYVDGISRDKLRLGAFSGSLELEDLTVKPDTLSLLGLEGFRIRHGTIKLIKVSVPWSKLYSGKLLISVEHLHIEIETLGEGCTPEEELVKEIQVAKEKAIEVRLKQLCNLVEQQEDQEQTKEGSKKKGMAVRLVRKILKNITVHLIDLRLSFTNHKRGLACGFELTNLAVLSTDQTFRDWSTGDALDEGDHSMYKRIRLQGLGISMSPAGESDLAKAQYVLSPISACLSLAHVPTDQILKVRLEVATEEVAELTLRRSEVKHIRRVQGELGAEAQHLHALVVPPEEEARIHTDVGASRAEYSHLYERHLVNQWKLQGSSDKPLTQQEELRRRALEDTFSARIIARERWRVRRKCETLQSEVFRRQEAAERARLEAERARSGFLGRLKGRWGSAGTEASAVAADAADAQIAWVTPEEREQLLQDMDDESKVEGVDLPQRFHFEFLLGQVAVDLVDDRHANEVQRQLLKLALKEANWKVDVRMATDHRGQDSAEWCTDLRLRSFQAMHASCGLIKLHDQGEAETGKMGDPEPGELGDGCDAVRLILKSSLQEQQNLLAISFSFPPLEFHILPGVIELLLDFIRAPAQPVSTDLQGAGTQASMGASETRVEEYLEVSRQLLEAHGDRAKEVVHQVYERIPDRMSLDIRIASPIVHVPVTGLGTSMFTLGQLRIATPRPCEYRNIDLQIELSNTEMRAVSVRKERFDMIQPVLINVAVEYKSTDDGNNVNVNVKAAEAALSLAPQAVQILLSTPTAIMSALYSASPASELESSLESLNEPAAIALTSPDDFHFQSQDELEVDAVRCKKTTVRRAKDLAQEVLGTEGDELFQAAARHMEEVRSKQLRLNLAMQFEALEFTLADSIVPVMRFRAEFMQQGLIMYFQNNPNHLTMNVDNGALVVDMLNPRNGAWEPLLERFLLGIELEKKTVGEDGHSTGIVLHGHEPVLVDLTPTAVQRANWIVPLFLDSLSAVQKTDCSSGAEGISKVPDEVVVKYRVVNLCGAPLQLSFQSRHRDDLVTLVEPTGSEWQSLDDWVLPHFTTALVASLPHGPASEALSLERAGAVAIPKSGYVAEVLTHSPLHRLVLLATPLRVHNRTDLTLGLCFHASTRERLPLGPLDTLACDAVLLGHALSKQKTRSQFQQDLSESQASHHDLVLHPNAIVAVPGLALVKAHQANIGSAHAWLSIKPLGLGVDFCVPVEVGDSIDPFSIFCRGCKQDGQSPKSPGAGGRGSVSAWSGVHFTCESSTYQHSLPMPTLLTTVAIQPTLVVLNALPCGNLAIKYTRSEHHNHWRGAAEERIPSFTRFNIYNFPGVRRDGIAISARFDDDSPWSSPPACFSCDSFKKEADLTQTIHLKQRDTGATASVIVEPLSYLEMRISCTNWFVDRSGLHAPLALTLQRHGQLLPCSNGITLLPGECMEEACELVLRSSQNSSQSHALRMPASWEVFPWKTSSGPYVFCVQVDDITPEDVLGAQCQIMTLRPRLLLTNMSSSELQLRFKDDKKEILLAGCSMEHHWAVHQGHEDSPTCNVMFRPRRSPPDECAWSSMVICGDTAAGSAAYVLPLTADAGGKSLGFEVWSTEVAPVRGAIAVSFRQGSDFVAVNRSTRTDISMAIKPGDCDDTMASLPLPPGGQEVPYGWLKPLEGKQRRSVWVVINKVTCRVDNVRESMRRTLRQYKLAIAVTLMGTRTILSVEDYEATAQDSGSPTSAKHLSSSTSKAVIGGGSSLSLELKLSRMGVSIIDEAPVPRELLFLHLELIRLEMKRDNDLQQVRLAISECQVDCQLPGRVDSHTLDRRRDQTLGLLQQERPAVIFANCADGDRAFFTLIMRRSATSSRDIVVPFMDVAFDALDVTIDDTWLVPFVGWISQTRVGSERGGVTFKHVQETAGKPVQMGYCPPPLPSVVQFEHLHIATLSMTMWCSFKVRSVRFLPQYMRTAIKVLSFSGHFTLDGAMVKLEDRTVPPHRGSLADFARGLASEYTMNLLHNASAMLGKSSVLNLPRVPLKFGMTSFSYMSDSLGLAFGEASSLLNQLTFDEDYVSQQRLVRSQKRIGGLQDGVVEAGKSLAQGIEGLFDVVTKPIEGAQKSGLGGFFVGVGKGVAGTLVKPFSKIGQAFSDVGSGVAAAVTPDTASMKRRRMRPRLRQPRLLFSQMGIVRPWSELDAEVLRQLGEHFTQGIEEILPLSRENGGHLVLLLYPQRFVLAVVNEPGASDEAVPAAHGERRATHTAFGHGGGAIKNSSSSGSGGGSSSSNTVATTGTGKPERLDFFEAIEESAHKIGSQVLKPINTVVFGVQDIEKMYHHSKQGNDQDQEMSSRGVQIQCPHKKFKAVRMSDQGLITLEDHTGDQKTLNCEQAGLSHAALNALVSGFSSAFSHHDGVANWDELQRVLRRERVSQGDSSPMSPHAGSPKPTGAGQRMLEVFEVERRQLPTGEWSTPYLPTDVEMSWRWLDSSGYRHPHLSRHDRHGRRLTREECAKAKKPPCELDGHLFKPCSDWTIDRNAGTDNDGWKYGIAWNSSTWDAKPNLFNGLRRRRWTRIFS